MAGSRLSHRSSTRLTPWQQLRAVFSSYGQDRVARMAASLSYYTAFSIAPLLVIAIAMAGLFLGKDAAHGAISLQIQGLVGKTGADAIDTMVQHAAQPKASIFATVISIITLLIGATGVFGELQDSLNTIWEVRSRPGRGVLDFLRQRFLSFTMVFGIGFLLLVSLLLTAMLAALGGMLDTLLAHGKAVGHVLNLLVSLGVIGALFAFTFKLLPDVRMRWRDVWIGAAVTACLFTAGKFAIGLYLGSSAIATSYGSVGSLAVLLIWVYYSSQIFLLGAEFTKVHAFSSGSQVTPKRHAEWLPIPELMHQGVAPPARPGDPEQAALSPAALAQPGGSSAAKTSLPATPTRPAASHAPAPADLRATSRPDASATSPPERGVFSLVTRLVAHAWPGSRPHRRGRTGSGHVGPRG